MLTLESSIHSTGIDDGFGKFHGDNDGICLKENHSDRSGAGQD